MNKKELVQAFVNNKEGRNHNSRVYSSGGAYNGDTVFRLHSTDIATITGGVLTLNTGGWGTVTTKSYMNLILDALNLPYHIKQVSGVWYWVAARNPLAVLQGFFDGDSINLNSQELYNTKN